MTSPGLLPWARPVAAVGCRETRRRLASVRQQAQDRPQLRGFRREGAARAWARLRRETRLQLQAMRQLRHTPCLIDEQHHGPGDAGEHDPGPSPAFPLQQKDTSPCTLHHHRYRSKGVCSPLPMDAPPGPIVSPCTV